MKVRNDLSDAHDAHRALGVWLDETETGGLDGTELVAELTSIIDQLDDVRARVQRALGG